MLQIVMIIAITIMLLVLVLTAIVIKKAYNFKHTIDPADGQPPLPHDEKNTHSQ